MIQSDLPHKERQKNLIHSIYVRQKNRIHSALGNRILLTYILLTNPSEQDSFDVYILSCAGRVAAQRVHGSLLTCILNCAGNFLALCGSIFRRKSVLVSFNIYKSLLMYAGLL